MTAGKPLLLLAALAGQSTSRCAQLFWFDPVRCGMAHWMRSPSRRAEHVNEL